MANNKGWEELRVGSGKVVAPTGTMTAPPIVCAIFYVDPLSTGIVRYRADQTDPTSTTGVPIRPGKSIVVAGGGNVRNSRFIAESGLAFVHALYYDAVDIVDLGLSGDAHDLTQVTQAIEVQTMKLSALYQELRRTNLGLELLGNQEFPYPDN